MPMKAALEAAREQLAYWQNEREAARRTQDSTRIARCDRFISQCELMISALISAQSKSSTSA